MVIGDANLVLNHLHRLFRGSRDNIRDTRAGRDVHRRRRHLQHPSLDLGVLHPHDDQADELLLYLLHGREPLHHVGQLHLGLLDLAPEDILE